MSASYEAHFSLEVLLPKADEIQMLHELLLPIVLTLELLYRQQREGHFIPCFVLIILFFLVCVSLFFPISSLEECAV